ncbi:MAG: hypothetical protein JWO06_3120 [Bacteroidota bacterium]|nr:hypothetical protein [Bacteroidota bacterium]
MKTIHDAIVFIKAEGNLLDEEIILHFDHLNLKFKDFLAKLELEDERTKTAFHLIVQSAFEGKSLTHEEKLEIEEQLKDLLKTADLVALTVLPGGTVVLVLATFLKLNRFIIPSVFLKQN